MYGVCSTKGIWKLQKKVRIIIATYKNVPRKSFNFVSFSENKLWCMVENCLWKMEITIQPVPQNCFLTYLETEKVMFIVFEWKELGVYDVRYNNVRQSSHKKMPRERVEEERKRWNEQKKKDVFFGDSASHFERSPNQGQWRVLMDHLLFMVCTNNKLLFIATAKQHTKGRRLLRILRVNLRYFSCCSRASSKVLVFYALFFQTFQT